MNKPINTVNTRDVDRFCIASRGAAEYHENLLNNYQFLAVRSAIYPGRGTAFGLMYAALGLAEAGEVQNKVKKIFRDDGILDVEGAARTMKEVRAAYFGPEGTDHVDDEGKRDDLLIELNRAIYQFTTPAGANITRDRRQQIIKELGGVLWYLAATCQEMNVTLAEVAEANLNELASRAQRGTLQGDGDNR